MNNRPALRTVYLAAAREATRGLKRNWRILFGSVGLVALLGLAYAVFGNLGIAGGMIAGMAEVAILALHYSWLAATVDRERLSWRGLLEFDWGMFFTVISVGFIFFVVQFLAGSLLHGLDQTPLLFLGLGLFLVFNAIPEVVIVERIEGLPALGRAAEFTREHALAWFLPLGVLLLPSVPLFGGGGTETLQSMVLSLAQLNPLVPSLAVPLTIKTVLSQLGAVSYLIYLPLVIVIANWYALFRVCLFRQLARLP